MSESVWPHRWQPTRLPRPWDSPGKNTGVGYHFLLHCMKVKSEGEVAQSCPTPSDPMDCSLPGSSVHGILQARILEWVAKTWDLHKKKSSFTEQFQEKGKPISWRVSHSGYGWVNTYLWSYLLAFDFEKFIYRENNITIYITTTQN